MTRADILAALFGDDHDVACRGDLLAGAGVLPDGRRIAVVGIADGAALGVDQAIILAGQVLAIAARDDGRPILMLVDSGSQRMRRRDELLGLSEYLAHLAKALLHAERAGHRTIALLHGGAAAGAFIATALACGTLVALPGAHPQVMDLASMARITKLPLDLLTQRAEATAVFAPGLDKFVLTGAVDAIWDRDRPLADQLMALLATAPPGDRRDLLGKARGTRPRAADIAAEVVDLARTHG